MHVDRVTLVAPAGEIRTKSRRTQPRFRRSLRRNLDAALRHRCVQASVADHAGRITLHGDAVAAAAAAASVFGVRRARVAQALDVTTLDEICEVVPSRAAERVAGRSFAVRVRRRGRQRWRSVEAERRIGAALTRCAAGVDLERPDVTVEVLAYDDDAFLVEAVHEGPGGLPLGTQGEALALLSGGFDSAVASWKVLRRGVTLQFLHAELACAQTDTALAVAHELWRRWAPGTEPVVWIVNFDTIRERLMHQVEGRVRQVRLKELMIRAADAIAERAGIQALVTGDAIGQVSTQTLHHLAVIDRFSGRSVLRPLIGSDKDEIVSEARSIGVHDLSLRSREVCDLTRGPVATRADPTELALARDRAPDVLAVEAAAQAWRLPLTAWTPGLPSPWAA